MPLPNSGRDWLAGAIVANPATLFNNANAYLGVGDSSTAFAASQTDLQAATNKLRKAMSASYPTIAGNVITARALFGTGDANFPWNEHGLFNAPSGGTMLYRKQESLGTKANTQSWQLTVDITLNNP